MSRSFIFLICFSLTLGLHLNAQVSELRKFNGIILDSISGNPIPFTNIQNSRNSVGTTSNEYGNFSLYVELGDTVLISSIGYKVHFLFITDTMFTAVPYQITIASKAYNLNDIHVFGSMGKQCTIPVELRSKVYNEKPHWTTALTAPLSYIFYHTSKTERNKRNLRKSILYEQEIAHVYQFYNKEKIKTFSGLEGEELNECMIYCNANMELNKKDTEVTINGKLLQVLSNYLILKEQGGKARKSP